MLLPVLLAWQKLEKNITLYIHSVTFSARPSLKWGIFIIFLKNEQTNQT